MSLNAAEVTIPDANLDKVLHDALGIPSGTPLTDENLSSITELSASDCGISDLTGINYCVNMGNANLSNNFLQILTPLQSLSLLQTLRVDGNNLTSLDSLSDSEVIDLTVHNNPLNDEGMRNLNFPNLTSLDATSCSLLTNTDFVQGMPKLTELDLSYDTSLKDISALATLPGLLSLTMRELTDTPCDFTPLSQLVHLTHLDMSDSWISNSSDLAGLSALQILYVPGCGVSDLNFVAGMTNLTTLIAERNNIAELSPLSGLSKLTALTVNQNAITSLDGLQNLPLKTLNVANNYLADIEELKKIINACSYVDYSDNFYYGYPKQNAFKSVDPISMMVSENIVQQFQVLYSEDGANYKEQSDTHSIAYGGPVLECSNKSVASAVLNSSDDDNWSMDYEIYGVAVGTTTLSPHYRPYAWIDALLPFTNGTTTCQVKVTAN
ncbi:leucine-rich repeat domain-containing protein [Paraburkholderia humisilvae]|uniref:Internalin-A n=1 Tax=Paraburkholderia humisilvae TaxID=627669 RepID=A0A6J5EQZ2_9BURK|nr:hypothetical protein [Paraburkholderia humisilvae]CAB3767636.1 hypothetical protein LMG29542_05664 [Paraburkholderia humisilvae]